MARRLVSAFALAVLAAALGATAAARANAADGNCSLWVPPHPASAKGLATPYRLTGDGCLESDPNVAAFVQAVVLDPDTGALGVYDPLVVSDGTEPAAAPTVPALPRHAVVGIWTGYNGNVLTLTGPGSRGFIQGLWASPFGQNQFYNAIGFFQAAREAIRRGRVQVPQLGTAKDGLPCPTVRDFSVVDQDQSDNTTDQYLLTADGRTAQWEPANVAALGSGFVFNGSDERTSGAIDKALGCSQWTVPDLADATGAQKLASYPLNELMAAYDQAPPVALVPWKDPFALVNGQPSLWKTDLYRLNVGQPLAWSLAQADTKPYCENLINTGMPRLAMDQPYTSSRPSPFPAIADSLYTFLAQRFSATISDTPPGLGCLTLLGMQDPVTLTTDANGVVVGAVYSLPAG